LNELVDIQSGFRGFTSPLTGRLCVISQCTGRRYRFGQLDIFLREKEVGRLESSRDQEVKTVTKENLNVVVVGTCQGVQVGVQVNAQTP